MKKYLVILLLLTLFSCTDTAKNEEVNEPLMDQSYFRHLSYLINIKNEVAQKHWPDFAENDFYQPVVYGTKENTFVLNPNNHIRKVTDHQEVSAFDSVSVIKLSEKYIDTTNFRFSVSFTSDSTALHYNDNVLYCQSFELTKKFLQDDLGGLQDWSIMVIHELFHGYQRSFPEAWEYFKTIDMPGGPDQFLGSYHKDLEWYRESVRKENDLLKAIWIEDADLNQNLAEYDSLRNLRIDKIKKEYGEDIRDAEDYEVTIEGNARYFESLVKRYLSKNRPNSEALNKADQELITDMFKEYEVSEDKGFFNIYNNRYYYPIGYNISMILEKYNVNYKESIYRKEHNIHYYLEELKNSQQ
jgi:hypothetical protein